MVISSGIELLTCILQAVELAMKFVGDRAVDVARTACPRLAEIKCYEQVCWSPVVFKPVQIFQRSLLHESFVFSHGVITHFKVLLVSCSFVF